MKNPLTIRPATVLTALFLILPLRAAQAQDSFVRILHGLSGASAQPGFDKVDVTIDGKKQFNDLEFGGISPYIRLDGGPHSITIRSNNPTRTLYSATKRFRPYDFHTLGLYGTSDRVRVLSANDSLGTPAPELAQLTAYHLSPGLPPFDVVTFQEGQTITLLKNVRYGQTRRASIPAFPMTVRLVRRGVIFKTLKGESPRAGRKYALYAIGRPSRNFRALLDVTASQ